MMSDWWCLWTDRITFNHPIPIPTPIPMVWSLVFYVWVHHLGHNGGRHKNNGHYHCSIWGLISLIWSNCWEQKGSFIFFFLSILSSILLDSIKIISMLQPAFGNPEIQTSSHRVICNYPPDPTVVLGFLSIASLTASVVLGYYSVLYPYNSTSVPSYVFFRSIPFFVFFLITMWIS